MRARFFFCFFFPALLLAFVSLRLQHLLLTCCLWCFCRHTTYYNRFKAAYAKENSTGWGVTDEDRKNGLFTPLAVLDHLCPFYTRMKDLYGERHNVMVPATGEASRVDGVQRMERRRDLVITVDDEEEEEEETPKASTPVSPRGSPSDSRSSGQILLAWANNLDETDEGDNEGVLAEGSDQGFLAQVHNERSFR